MESYDYIVVGAGSSGSIVAAELVRAGKSVLLLEAGPSAEEHPQTLEADGYKLTFVNDEVFYDRFSEPQPHTGQARVFMGTGKVVGGSGSVNGMVYTRGSRQDFEEWPEGWRWGDVDPDFRAVEARLRVRPRPGTQWTEACIGSAEANGFRRSPDFLDGNFSDVIGYEAMSYEGEARRSSYAAFIKEDDLASGSLLSLRTGAAVKRLELREGRATGVYYSDRDGNHQARARAEVVLCAGALETPRLLQLSGVGPAEWLREAGVPVVHDQPEVGRNLHDHPNVPVFFRAARDVDSRYPQLYSFYRTHRGSDLPEGQSDTCYVYWPAPSAMKYMVQRMLPPMVLPPALYHTRAKQWVRSGIGSLFDLESVDRFVDRLFGIIVILGKPKSRGEVRIRSSRGEEPAAYHPHYLEHAEDLEVLVQGVRKARAIAASGPLATWGAKEVMPGAWCKSEAALRWYVKRNMITTYHFAGTCRMGSNGSSVVDTRLRFRGLQGLRIADASVIPWTPVSALNAPSMLIGYRAARYLLEEQSDSVAS
ncbi:MAG: GMC family oxidoreductase [Polyangiaceae bacterium]